MVRTVLSAPGVARVFCASMLGRIPAGALGLLLVLRVRELGGGYAAGGLAAGALSLGMGAAAPLVGRVVDARGQTRVLVCSAAACAGALAALALVPAGTALGVLLALAAVAGAAHPPLAACLRALWSILLPDPARRHAAFAVEAIALEVSYILGPLVLVGAIATQSAAAALGVSATLIAAGTAAFAAAPPSRAWRPQADVRRGLLGALASPGIRSLLAVQAAVGFSFGAIEVSVVAFAEDAGARGAIGPLLAGWGVASMAGGALAIRRGAPKDPARRLAVVMAALAAGDALLVLATGAATLGALLFVAGLAIAAGLHGPLRPRGWRRPHGHGHGGVHVARDRPERRPRGGIGDRRGDRERERRARRVPRRGDRRGRRRRDRRGAAVRPRRGGAGQLPGRRRRGGFVVSVSASVARRSCARRRNSRLAGDKRAPRRAMNANWS